MSASTPSRLQRRALASLLLLGAALRVWACFWDPPLHADEYFQYVEPAWWRWTGVGSETWEWRDGLRSWVLPFYHGAWLAFLSVCGVRDGAVLGAFLRVHWALINGALVWVAYRAGTELSACLLRQRGTRQAAWGGLLAAALCACFPPLVLYAGHTLSEMPSMLCLVAGLTLTAELARWEPHAAERTWARATWAGGLLALGACLRIANGPLVLLPTLWLAGARRWRELALFVTSALGVALLFALVDLVTWGKLAGSFVAYLRFNLVEGKAARFGTEPPLWYVEHLWATAPLGLTLVALVALGGARASWPYLLSALILLGYLSTQPHKEARFIIGFWPPLLIACGGTLGAVVVRVFRPPGADADARLAWVRRCLGASLVVAVALPVLVDAVRQSRAHDWLDNQRVQAIAWVGRQHDLTGLLIDDIYAVSGPIFHSSAPRFQYDRSLLYNAIVSHVLVPADSVLRREAEFAGFRSQQAIGKYLILRRAPAAAQ